MGTERDSEEQGYFSQGESEMLKLKISEIGKKICRILEGGGDRRLH